jgi:hypothetical protein
MTAGKSSRPRNGSRSSANISSFGSELSLPTTAVGTSGQFTLNLAAKKVDRMLKEMAGLQGLDPPVPECPFPRELAQPPHQQQSQPSCSRHGNNNNGTYDSRCLSEYENNDSRRSLANCGGSDSEAGGFGGSFSRLDRLKRALLLGRGAGRTNNISSGNVKGPGSGGAQQPSAKRKAAPDGGTRDGNEADRSCSPSVTSSVGLLGAMDSCADNYSPSFSKFCHSTAGAPKPHNCWACAGDIRLPTPLAMRMNMRQMLQQWNAWE